MKTISSLCINLVVLIISEASAVKLIAGDRNVVKKDGATHTISKYYVVPNDFDPNNITNSNTTEVSQKKTFYLTQNDYPKRKSSKTKAISRSNKNNDQVGYYNVVSNHTIENNKTNKVVVNETKLSWLLGQNDTEDQAENTDSESTKSRSSDSNLEPDNLELEDRKSSNNLVQENVRFQTRLTGKANTGYDLGNPYSGQSFLEVKKDVQEDSRSNQPYVDLSKTNKHLRSRTSTTIKSKVTDIKPVSTETKVIKTWIVDDSSPESTVTKWVVEGKSPDSTEINQLIVESKGTDNYPLTTESRVTKPWVIVHKSTEGFPSTDVVSRSTDLSGHFKNKTIYQLPWHIEDKKEKKAKHLALNTKDKVINHQPWTIKQSNNLPWVIEDRLIEKNGVNNNFGHSPITLYNSDGSSVKTTTNKILINTNRPKAVHWVKNKAKKPYRIYTYVIKPGTSLYEIPKSGKIDHATEQANSNLLTKSYSLSTSQEDQKYVKSSPSQYESQFLLKPSIDRTSQSGKSQLKHTKYVTTTYDTVNKANNTSGRYSTPSQDDDQPKHPVKNETNYTLETLHASESETNSNEDKDKPSKSKAVISHSEFILPKGLSNPFQSLFLTQDKSLLTTNTSSEKPDVVNTELYSNNTDINVNVTQYTNEVPGTVSKFSVDSDTVSKEIDEIVYETHQPNYITKASTHSEFTVSNENINPTPDNSEDINQTPGYIPTGAYHPAYTKIVYDYDKPTVIYDENPSQHSGYTTKTSSHSEFTVSKENNNAAADYSGDINQNTGYTTKTSSHSEFTIPSDNNNPTVVTSADINQGPDFIPMVPYHPQYTEIVEEYDEPTLIIGEHPSQHSGYTTKTSSHSEFTVSKENNNPTVVSSASGYTEIDDDYNESILVHGKNPSQHPGYITKTTTHSEYTIPNDYNNPTAVSSVDINKSPGFIPNQPEYTNVVDVPSQNASQHSDFITTAHSEITKILNSTTVNNENIDLRPNLIPVIPNQLEHAKIVDDINEPILIHGENPSQHSGYTKKITTHSEYTIPNDYNNPTAVSSANINKSPGFIPSVPYQPGYTEIVDDHYETPLIYGGNPSQHSGYTTKTTSHSEFTIPNYYNNPTAVSSIDINKIPGFIPMVPYQPGYTNVVNDYNKLSNVPSQNTPQNSGFITTANSEVTKVLNDYSNPATGKNVNIDQNPDLNPVKIIDDLIEPIRVHGGNPSQHPGYITKTTTHSEYTIPNDYNNPTAVSSVDINKSPGFIPNQPEYTKVVDEPSNVPSQNASQHPGFITTAHSEITKILNSTTVNNENIDQYPDLVPVISNQPEYSKIVDDFNETILIHGENPSQHSDSTTKTTSQSEFIIPSDYNNPTVVSSADINTGPDFIPMVPYQPGYTEIVEDYNEPILIHGKTPTKQSGYTTKTTTHSEFTIPNYYNNPTAISGADINKIPGFIPTVPYQPGYTNVVHDYNKLSKVPSQNTPQNSGFVTTAHSKVTNNDYSNPTYGNNENIDQRPDLVPVIPNEPDNAEIVDDYNEPILIHGKNPTKQSGYTTKTTTHSESTIPNYYNNPTAVSGADINKIPGFIPMVPYQPGYTNVVHDYNKLSNVPSQNTPQNSGFITTAYSKVTNTLNDYSNPTTGNNVNIDQRPDLVPVIPNEPDYAKIVDDFNEPILIHGKNPTKQSGYTTKTTTHSKSTIPNYYNNPTAVSGADINKIPGFIPKVPYQPGYTNIVDDYNEPSLVYGDDTVQYPGWKGLSNMLNHYSHYGEDVNTDLLNDDITQSTLVDDGLTENEYGPLGYQQYGSTVQMKPSYLPYLHDKQVTNLNNLKNMIGRMAPTYKLFTLDNLLKLRNAVTKAIGITKTGNSISLINLKKIINIILVLADKLNESDESNEWYMKIFNNAEKNPHPLQPYVYNLIRQRWLHELMLILWKNNFNINTLQNPRIFSFLKYWQFPNYVQNFLTAEDLKYYDFDLTHNLPNGLPDQFSTQTHLDSLENMSEDLEKYVTHKVIESYKAPDDGIVVSIAGVEIEPDANAIVNILQNYLHSKTFQQNMILHDNKVEMLKQIVLYLTQKGYSPKTIGELVYKLFATVDSTEEKKCDPYHPNFAKNVKDKVLLPVLRRSGR